MKIRFDSYDDLSLNKILCFSVLNILCESVFQIKNEYYPQVNKKMSVNMSVRINFYSFYKRKKSNQTNKH